MRTLYTAALLLLMAAAVRADDSRSLSSVPSHCGYSRETVGVDGSGNVVDFSSNQIGWGTASRAHMVRIRNRDASDSLLIDELVFGDSVEVSSLSTPVVGTEAVASRVDTETERSYNGVSWIGVVLQNEDDVSDDQGTISVDVEWCY